MYGANLMYNTTFVAHTNAEIMNRSFKYVTGTNNHDNTINIFLCLECSQHLALEDNVNKKSYTLCKYTWPTFVCFLLKDHNVQSKYGGFFHHIGVTGGLILSENNFL